MTKHPAGSLFPEAANRRLTSLPFWGGRSEAMMPLSRLHLFLSVTLMSAKGTVVRREGKGNPLAWGCPQSASWWLLWKHT